MQENVYVIGCARTPNGGFLGGLAPLSAGQLGAIAAKEAIARSGCPGDQIDEVIMGNVIGAGLGQNVARQCALGAGLPVSVGATTVSKVCGSGLRAVIAAAQAIQSGDARRIVAGGTESMSNAPYLLPRARTGYRMGNGELVDSMIQDGLWDVYTHQHMGNCGELCAEKYSFSRKQQDDFAVESFRRATQAWDNGHFDDEVVAVDVQAGRKQHRVEKDEGVAQFRGEEKLRALKPAFHADGTITAGNASSISDGAAAMVVCGEDGLTKSAQGVKGKILGYAGAATDSEWFSTAPILAMRKLFDRIDLKTADVDIFEINEAFGVVAMAAIKELELPADKVNPHGGAVALGHPIGATGARLVVTLLHALERGKKRIGVASLCIGGGEALALAVERCTK